MSSPLSSCSSIPASPPLVLTASPRASPAYSAYSASPIGSPAPAVSCTQSLLEELAVLEPMFGAGASIAPGLGQQPELYQLQCHPSPQCFHQGKRTTGLWSCPLLAQITEYTSFPWRQTDANLFLFLLPPSFVFQMGVEVFLRSKISL